MRGREEESERGSPSSESPLRQALGGKTPTSSTTTPILSASLNAPPMLNHEERSGNGGLDLSRLGFCRRSRELSNEEEESRRNGLYKHLISQLQSGPPKRLKASLSSSGSRFQCPVCRKRFQRHIALNAHFQSEHIGEDSHSKEKSCKICQTRLSSSDPSTIRLHLLSAHRIDLENPAACLISDESVNSTGSGAGGSGSSKYSVLRASLSSSPDDESSVGSSSSIM
uniref:Zinc finger protein 91like [Acyrthosiphon pisum] n=1 Tax=Lepeophtheirus salmonis TaxID=72036 RepID=A0A0K2V1Q0_LEPSM